MLAVVFAASVLAISPASVTAAIVSSTPAQTFLAIGGSGAWWPNHAFNFPEAVRQNISTLLFSQSGLGLSSYRFNVGGGGVGVATPAHAPQTFYVSPGVYNFSADPQGMYFLQAAAAHGVPSFTAFVNSAPPGLTSNGASCGGSFVSGTGEAFGEYLADVVAHLRSLNINVDFVSPMNEPDDAFGTPGTCTQEGMQVAADQRAEVINGVFNALENRGLSTSVGILADEAWSGSLATSELPTWLPSVEDKVAAIAHHIYDFPSDASYASFVDSVKSVAPGKATWMSDICCSLGTGTGTGRGYTQGFDPTIDNALMFSGIMFQSLVLANEPVYDFWTLVSASIGCSPLNDATCFTPNSVGWNDGLIYLDPDYATNNNFNLYIAKHFWTFKHFGNFIKPGSVRMPLEGPDVRQWMMAVSTPSTYNVILMNPNTTDSTLTLSFPDTVCPVSAFRTSGTEDFATVAKANKVPAGAFLLPLKSMSLTTYTFDRAAC
ncbi:hypothetical protein MVEN_01416800 [Mycena venus]|uniref:Endo-beta-1,6-galactanase-like domain-containing protein n=1 Tax=Mycena venus TaxID=2733690 RepID=A0A8H6XYL9_9AGAR|nr:hypothetical protein MVEN_01416800 [Mycena venus]